MGEMDERVDIKPEGADASREDTVVQVPPAAATPPPNTPDDDRRRRRLDRELGFSAPGPAFQMAEMPPGASPSGSTRRSMRHSSRTPKPSKAALESGMLSTWKAPPAEAVSSSLPPSFSEPSPTDVYLRCKALHEQLAQADMDTRRREHDALVRELFQLSKSVTRTSMD